MFVVRHLLSHGAPWRTVYLQGIDVEEIIGTIHARRAPMMHVSAGLSSRDLARPNRRAGALHGATARRPRPDSAASRDCGSESLLAGVVGAAQGPKRREDCSVSISAAVA